MIFEGLIPSKRSAQLFYTRLNEILQQVKPDEHFIYKIIKQKVDGLEKYINLDSKSSSNQ